MCVCACVLSQDSCILEFDGASKGNPGQAGAGAVLRAEDGSVVYSFEMNVMPPVIASFAKFFHNSVFVGLAVAGRGWQCDK